MRTLLSFSIRTLRRFFYNTPVKHWRLTEWIYARVGRLLIGNNPYPILELEGMKLMANGEDVILTAAVANGNYEPFTLRIFRELMGELLAEKGREECVFIDVGANIGVFTVTAALLHPEVRVFAFEPHATSYRLLKENLQLNGLRNVFHEQAAVGAQQGTASLDISSPQAGMHSIYGPGTRRVDVPVVSLGDFILEKGFFPSFIKVDVEGYEPQVLQGMKSFSPEHPFKMILEFHPEHLRRGGRDPEDFLEELVSQFDFVSCLDEIEQRVIPYVRGDAGLKEKIIRVGYNLLLGRGARPDSIASASETDFRQD